MSSAIPKGFVCLKENQKRERIVTVTQNQKACEVSQCFCSNSQQMQIRLVSEGRNNINWISIPIGPFDAALFIRGQEITPVVALPGLAADFLY